jgi:hypothetical protein
VELYYFTNNRRFNSLLGKSKDFLPAADILSSKVYWTLYLPEDGRYHRFESDLDPTDEWAQAPPKDGNEISVVSKTEVGAEGQGFRQDEYQSSQQTMNRYKWFKNVGKAKELQKAGIPVKIQFPTTGVSFHFKKLMGKASWSPEVSFIYLGDNLIPTLFILTLLFSALLAWILFGILFKRKKDQPTVIAFLLMSACSILMMMVTGKWGYPFLILLLGPLAWAGKMIHQNRQKWQKKLTPERTRLFGTIFCLFFSVIALFVFKGLTILFWFLGGFLGVAVTLVLYYHDMQNIREEKQKRKMTP